MGAPRRHLQISKMSRGLVEQTRLGLALNHGRSANASPQQRLTISKIETRRLRRAMAGQTVFREHFMCGSTDVGPRLRVRCEADA